MASCILFHGPGARQAALGRAADIGRLVAPPFGDDGLKVEAAREVALLLLTAPVGRDVGVVVVGPMDLATSRASDVLLKRIEELPDGIVQPLLWAHDQGSVSSTIRSRCLDEWAPSLEDEEDDDSLVALAWRLIGAVLSGEMEHIPSIYRAHGKETEMLGAMAGALSTDLDDPDKRALWDRLREVSQWKNPQLIEIASALVGD